MTVDILSMMEEAEWTPRQGRPGEDSPYLPAVAKSAEAIGDDPKKPLGKPFKFTVNVGIGKADDQDKELTKHVNQLRKAGRQTTPPVTVLVNAGDVNRKSGDVSVTFVARRKITKPTPAAEAPTTAQA